MHEQRCRCGETEFSLEQLLEPAVQEMLLSARESGIAVHCACRTVPMVTRLFRGRVFVARWPDTGAMHAPECPSFDMSSSPAAVQEREDGTIEIRASFQLREPWVAAQPEMRGHHGATGFHVERPALGLQEVLRELWKLSGLDKWFPGLLAKRKWHLVRYRLLNASIPVCIQDESLADRLFIPETYRKDAPAHGQEQLEKLHALASKVGRVVLVAPLLEIEGSKYGYRIKFTHLSEARAYMKQGGEIATKLRSLAEGNRLIGIALLEQRQNYFKVVELAFLPVTKHWLPFASGQAGRVMDDLVEKNHSFQAMNMAVDDTTVAFELAHGSQLSRIILSQEAHCGWENTPLTPPVS